MKKEMLTTFIHITIGEPNSLTWNAYDTSAGNGANLRRFFIRFVNGPQMFSFLLYGFGGNYELVNDFLTEGSRFFRTERNRPPHPVIQDVNAMRLDGEGEDLPAEIAPLNEEEAEALYGEYILNLKPSPCCLRYAMFCGVALKKEGGL